MAPPMSVRSRIGACEKNVLMVGDYRHDTDAGKAAGAMTVLLTNGRVPMWTVTADLVIERLPQLLAHIE